MFNASITRFVDSYDSQNPEFFLFCTRHTVESLPNSRVNVYSRHLGKSIFELTMSELKDLYAPLIDVTGGSNKRRMFVLYHHLVKLGIKLN
jgi:hypothetical protein